MLSQVDPELMRIVNRALPGARLLRAVTLGADDAAEALDETAKVAGYGAPVRIDVEVAGERRSLVLHQASPNPFGHDRRADRAAELLLAADTFDTIPEHTRVLDVGAFRRDGASISLADTTEFYLLTDYAQGHPYAEDLRRLAEASAVGATDLERADVLVDYLVALHTPVAGKPMAYQRSLRDLLGSGEGIFGIIDAFGLSTPGVSAARLQSIEARCLEWRWRLKERPARLARIHGDFHPFNVLFTPQGALKVLDTSRGSVGDPADDVACMAVNFVFFAIDHPERWHTVFAPLWRRFWERYLERSNDQQLLATVAPFLAWRLLVLACPVWYPNASLGARQRLFALLDAALDHERFEPELAEQVFR
jgi:streptomycin 6-kinase